MRDEITKITVNDELTDPQGVCRILKAVSDKKLLVEKGGYVFKASIKDSHLFLGLMPGVIGDRKIYHYDLKLPVEGVFALSGNFNAKGTITLLFEIAKKHLGRVLPEKLEAEICASAARLARFMVTHGVRKNMELDTASQIFLKNSGLFPTPPTTLGELAEAKLLTLEE